MRKFTSPFLRLFVILMLSVFVSETVYASSMMAFASMPAQKVSQNVALHQYDNAYAEHCHKVQDDQKLSNQAHHKQSGNSYCHHCVACFSMISQGQFNLFVMPMPMVEKVAFVEIYHSPTSAQLQKPPIL